VTIRQLLNHTSGVPEYTSSDGLAEHLGTNPGGAVSPTTILGWVRGKGLSFTPGSSYTYSTSDNSILGLIAEAVTRERYDELLASILFRRAGLAETRLATTLPLPRPFIHGYDVTPGQQPKDVTTLVSPTIGWASGAIVSTPLEVARFVRAYLRGRFFGAAQKRAQRRFVPGESAPAGPGRNSAGLALFRCGTVFGHTGSFYGFAQWAAASADGKRSVTTTLNIAPPSPGSPLLARLRRVQTAAVCTLLRG
jgi:D-alanyl-D-alanine carboxypeptidase